MLERVISRNLKVKFGVFLLAANGLLRVADYFFFFLLSSTALPSASNYQVRQNGVFVFVRGGIEKFDSIVFLLFRTEEYPQRISEESQNLVCKIVKPLPRNWGHTTTEEKC